MKILKWLFRSPRFNRFEDSFAIRRESLWPMLREAVHRQRESGRSVWLVAHFPDTFVALQNKLAEWGLEYRIVDRPLDPQSALGVSRSYLADVQLVLAELLVTANSQPHDSVEEISISMIVVERHPHIDHDRRLETFARSMPCPVRFGYYLAIDDVVLRRVINETTVQILKQLGMDDHELITSNLITRRLEKVLSREASQHNHDRRADSAEEWYSVE